MNRTEGEIIVYWSNINSKSWIGMYKVEETDPKKYITYEYCNDSSYEVKFSNKYQDDYKFMMISNSSKKVLAECELN